MVLKTPTISELTEESFEWLLQNTEITLLTPGSTARALIESANIHLGQFYSSMTMHLAQSYLSKASQQYLDLLGEMLGVSRRGARAAVITQEDRAIRFYVAQGTLSQFLPKSGDLTKGVIPAGTTVTSVDGTIVYTIERDVEFPRAATEAFAPARASTVGSEANVGANVLRAHNLNIGAVLVTNPVTIATGVDPESDDEYRFRIRTRVISAEGANESAVRLAVLSAPGVADVRINKFQRGAGSFDVLIIPTGNRVALETIEISRQNLASAVAFGIDFKIREPKYVRISMVVALNYKNVLRGEQNAVRANAERAILNYLSTIPIGGQLVVNQLGAALLESDERIKDYDIQGICVDGRPQIIHNYQLEDDELFLPDENLTDPVRVI